LDACCLAFNIARNADALPSDADIELQRAMIQFLIALSLFSTCNTIQWAVESNMAGRTGLIPQ
jgi:hypothetical protein